MSFRNKYLKYKEKYLNLKKLLGGSAQTLESVEMDTITNEYLEGRFQMMPEIGGAETEKKLSVRIVNNREPLVGRELQAFIDNFNHTSHEFSGSVTEQGKNKVKFTRKLQKRAVAPIAPMLPQVGWTDINEQFLEHHLREREGLGYTDYRVRIVRGVSDFVGPELTGFIISFNSSSKLFSGSVTDVNKGKVTFTRRAQRVIVPVSEPLPPVDIRDINNDYLEHHLLEREDLGYSDYRVRITKNSEAIDNHELRGIIKANNELWARPRFIGSVQDGNIVYFTRSHHNQTVELKDLNMGSIDYNISNSDNINPKSGKKYVKLNILDEGREISEAELRDRLEKFEKYFDIKYYHSQISISRK